MMTHARAQRPARSVPWRASTPVPFAAPAPAHAPTAGRHAAAPVTHDFGAVSVHGPTTGAGPIQRWPDWGKMKKDAGDAWSGMFGSKVGPLQGPRNDLDTHVGQFTNPSLFTRLLRGTNRGLGINTDAELPSDKAQKYMEDSSAVESGQMPNSRAFLRSAADWRKRGNYVGSGLNYLGGGASYMGESVYNGVMEDLKRKKGQL